MTFTGRDGRSWTFDEANLLGEPGGFGEVFPGRDLDGRTAAVKRVRLRRDDEATRRRRDREVEIANLIAAAVGVDHLPAPVDVGTLGDNLLLVLPLADESLRAALD